MCGPRPETPRLQVARWKAGLAFRFTFRSMVDVSSGNLASRFSGRTRRATLEAVETGAANGSFRHGTHSSARAAAGHTAAVKTDAYRGAIDRAIPRDFRKIGFSDRDSDALFGNGQGSVSRRLGNTGARHADGGNDDGEVLIAQRRFPYT